MSSEVPSPTTDYAAPQGMALNKVAWDAAMVSIGQRLDAIEARSEDLQAVIDAGTTQALAVISDNVEPQLLAVAAQIQALDDAIAASEDQLASTEGAILALLAGGVGASNVIVADISGLTATDAQAALAELLLAIEANATAIGTKANAADVYTTSQVYTKSEVDTAIASSGTSIATLMAFS